MNVKALPPVPEIREFTATFRETLPRLKHAETQIEELKAKVEFQKKRLDTLDQVVCLLANMAGLVPTQSVSFATGAAANDKTVEIRCPAAAVAGLGWPGA